MAASLTDEIHWTGHAVRADQVAAQMLALRQSAADEDGYPLARASVMNLVVYASDKVEADHATSVVDEIAIRHPSRAIVVGVRPGRTFSLDAEVNIRRHPLASHRLVYERAILRPQVDNPEGIDTLVIPLLIPHLQTFLWWLGDPNPADPALRSLAAISDRLVIDSTLGAATLLAEVSMHLGPGADASSAINPRLVLGDMGWTRLDMFRQTLARAFDEHQRSRYLDGLTRVEIEAARSARSDPSPAELLLAGWLGARLGCTSPVRAGNGVAMRMEPEGSAVQVDFTPVRGGRPAGAHMPVRIVRLWAEHAKTKVMVELEVLKEHAHLTVTETGSGRVSRTVPMTHPSEAEVLSRELARLGRDRVFEDALSSAARIQVALSA